MIPRYETKEMKRIWSEKNKFDNYLKVELAASHAWYKLNLFDEQTFNKLNKASYKLKEIKMLELETKHDVIAFTRSLSNSLGDEKKWIHYGLTSTDIVDTAYGLILKDANKYILKSLNDFQVLLKNKALQYKNTLIMGRTHGMHAEITSFGLKYALWYSDFKRLRKNFEVAANQVQYGKLSGAVGNFSATTPLLEEIALKYLKLNIPTISTQTLQRDRHANYIAQIALIGSQLEKIAIEMRHLSRTEIGEISEFFGQNQKGSSAMPHKKNPVGSENITGLARLLRGYMVSSFENISLWHERDISHSSVERMILPDATTLIHYMLKRMHDILNNLIINEDQMLKNIDLNYGIIHAQRCIHALIDKGLSRESAYDLIQKLTIKAVDLKVNFKDILNQDDTIKMYLNIEEINQLFDTGYYIRYVDVILDKTLS